MKDYNVQPDQSSADFGMQMDQTCSNMLYVHTFGTLTLQYADKKIDCVNNRSNLIWNILAYLISNQGKSISTENLIEHAKGSPGNASPANAMRTAIFRARRMLNELVGNTDHTFLVSQNGGYMWKPDIPMFIDFVEFERLMMEIKENPTDLERMLTAFKLYDGKFLAIQSSELWVIPRQVYYHKLYESLLEQMFPLLEKEKKYFDAICACRKILQTDPFSERNYQNLMRFLLMNNEREEVIKVYKKMSKIMLTDLGVLPNQESRALYHEALSVSSCAPLSADDIAENLSEQYLAKGAYICDYDCFKALYQANARSIERSGIVSHIAIVSLIPNSHDIMTPDHSQTMEDLEKTLRQSLRRGDVITRCSASQFIVMLLAANYENSQRVCERFTTTFHKMFPHCRYEIECEVRPIQS